MYDTAEMLERHAAALKVLAERALALACAVQERALAAETGAEMAELSLAFHRISRSTRQCLALEAKLVRDAERAAREVQADAAREGAGEAHRRKGKLRGILRRMIMDEGGTVRVPDEDADEDDEDAEIEVWNAETEGRLEHLETLLDVDELDGRLVGVSVSDQIERLRADLGLGADEDEDPSSNPAIPGVDPGTQTHDGFRPGGAGAAETGHPPNSS